MELVFNLNQDRWEAEFKTTADFNIHIERVGVGRFLVYQKSVADGAWAIVDGLSYNGHKTAIDLDFTASVYPKWIKVVSEVKVTMGVVTFKRSL